LRLPQDYIGKIDRRIARSMTGIESMAAAAKTKEDAESVIRRIDSFLEVIAYSQKKISLNMQEIRRYFEIKKLSLGFFKTRAKIDLDKERDRRIAEWGRVLSSIEKHITLVKRIRKSVKKRLTA